MNRVVVGSVLIAVGAFLIVLAPLMRFQVAPALIAAAGDHYGISKLRATGAQYFSIPDGKVLTADLDIIVTTRGDVKEASGDRVVWDEFTAVNDVTNGKPGINFTERRSAFDKRSGVGLNCCGVSVDKAPVQLQGQIYKFPFDVEKKSYMVFNSTTGKAYEARFVGEEQVNGLNTYKFEQTVPETKTQTLNAPAAMFGMGESGDVQLNRYYSGTNTYWIEPTTGAPVRQEQQRNEVLKSQDGIERSKAFVAAAKMTDDTVNELVTSARDGKSQITLIKTTLPIVLAVVGIVLFVGGVFLTLRGRRAA
ncbi:DUF3068 domain-containing protein [Nonomuraea turkmeniaca]|uniref:DUF3068 domain-containing protein n=1 Tax=Nonomuraea turkmeniaca TaxID=103838 RepID=A0A5S4FK10_9ACTN|nr:DUF3068 domain-containing protein [Nonomuraea turkmeniaca]TMR21077.1 DUF3068 domain-containing protein [Nonomuraea turkmeniaca]